MSRYNPTRDSGPVLDAAQRWIRTCLIDGGSLLGDKPLWQAATIDELVREFTDKPDESESNFFDKLQRQMRPATAIQRRNTMAMKIRLARGGSKKRPFYSVVAADSRELADATEVGVDVERWRRLALDVLAVEGAVGELTLTFVDVDDIAELNEHHMGKQGPTDVLSFPMDDEPVDGVPTLLGDVVISPAVAAGQFADHAGTLDDELALLVVHGILHVLGHDHAEPDETAVMRGREVALLERFHWGGSAPSGFRQQHS